MRDLSLFLIKNSLGAKMKKGLRNFCNDDGSTSTLNQHHKTTCTDAAAATSTNPAPLPVVRSPTTDYNYYLQENNTSSINDSDHALHQPPTLEEMILRLDLEEEIARSSKYSKPKDYNKYKYYKGRMSCVNNSDILRSARNALNQYPRFSLDGKDAMYRSSFRNSLDHDFEHDHTNAFTRTKLQYCRLPATVAGERVKWCKPGVVAKLMGLEAMPVPVMSSTGSKLDIASGSIIDVMNMKKRNLMIRRRAHDHQRHELGRRLVSSYMDINGNGRQCDHRIFNKKAAAAGKRTTAAFSSCTTSKTTSAGYNNNYHIMKAGVANS
ncbi:hypothetical protein TB2_005323 [Malus domestica]